MPLDRGVIDSQLKDIGHGANWWEQREFRDLPHILDHDEVIRGLVNGKLRVSKRPRLLPRARWLIVTTDRRVICLKQERFGRKQVEIDAGDIVEIRHGSRLRGYQIVISTAVRRFRIRIPKAEAFRFVGTLHPLMPRTPPPPSLNPELSALSWVPGIRTVASLPGFAGIIDKVTMLSPPDYATREDLDRAHAHIDRLEDEVTRLGEKVEFLETLLRTRAGEGQLVPEHTLEGNFNG